MISFLFSAFILRQFTPISSLNGAEVWNGDNNIAASIRLQREKNNFVHVCAGGIIHRYWVITLISCLEHNQGVQKPGDLSPLIKVYSGHSVLGQMKAKEVAAVLKYGGYNAALQTNDVALINVKSALTENPLEIISNYNKMISERPVRLFGWGEHQEGETGTSLKVLSAKLMQDYKCAMFEVIGSQIKKEGPDFIYCLLGENAVGATAGDEGGPVVYKTGGVFKVIGLIQYFTQGMSCNRLTVIHHFNQGMLITWIRDNVRD